MARDFNGTSTDYLSNGSDILSAASVWTFAAWIKLDAIGAVTHTVMAIATAGSANHSFVLDVSTTGNLRFRARDTGVSDASIAGVTAGSWIHVACIKRAGNGSVVGQERSVYLNGTRANNNSARTPAGMNATGLGYSPQSTGANYLQGLIAYPTWWLSDIGDTDITALAAGAWPGSIGTPLDLMRLSGSSPEVGDNGTSFTVNGTTYSTDEPISPPSSGGSGGGMLLLGVG